MWQHEIIDILSTKPCYLINIISFNCNKIPLFAELLCCCHSSRLWKGFSFALSANNLWNSFKLFAQKLIIATVLLFWHALIVLCKQIARLFRIYDVYNSSVSYARRNKIRLNVLRCEFVNSGWWGAWGEWVGFNKVCATCSRVTIINIHFLFHAKNNKSCNFLLW